MKNPFAQTNLIWLALLAAVAFGISVFSPVSYAGADPAGTLLASQSLVQNGTFKLDSYRPWMTPSYRFITVNKHYYYAYPLGTPVFSTPFVWAAGLNGDTFWPLTPADENLQNILSGLTVAGCALLIFFLLRAYCSFATSYLLAAAFTFGTTITSTLGTALWSVNLATVFSLASLILVVYEATGKREKLNPYWLGFLLFSAYFCRPSEILFVGLVLAYMFVYRRSYLLRVGLTCGLLLAVFMLYSYLELRQPLPIYYRSSDFVISGEFFKALYGNLLSPSRGLLIFSPFLLLTLVGCGVYFKTMSKNPVFQLAAGWFLAHLVLISAWKIWWGGQSYGPRLFTDALPAMVILLALVWEKAREALKPEMRKVWMGAFLGLAAISIFIHSYQGMFNPWTAAWNDGDSVTFLDWKYPEFLATPQMLAQREAAYFKQHLQPYRLGDPIGPDEPKAVYENWYKPEDPSGGTRWSMKTDSSIYVLLGAGSVDPARNYVFQARLGGFTYTKVKILVNGQEIGSTPLRHAEPENFVLNLPGRFLRAGQVNQIEFQLDLSAAEMDSVNLRADSRMRGISLTSLSISP